MAQEENFDKITSVGAGGEPCVMSFNFVDLLKGSDLLKPVDRIPQSGDQLSFNDSGTNQLFSPKYGGTDFLNVAVRTGPDQIAFLKPSTEVKLPLSARLDGKRV
jgi:hypothetical protein